jgi:SSS family solute:Na+ symporter
MTHGLDLTLFALYLVFNIALGIWVARRRTAGTRDYFLAGEGLPWYTIGGSIIAANISTEHFIGMIGVAYAVGFVVAQWEWGNWFTFSALIWVFLPYYIRGGLYTMPEFLERRYNSTCRYLFAVCSLVLWIIAQMAVVMLAGGKAMKGMFGIDERLTILGLAVLAGSYTIYGGLRSVAWTDFLQFVVMMLGGLIVTVIGLQRVDGLGNLMHFAPGKFKIIYPITDKDYPWFGVWSLFISIGIWYNCTNQFIVQRCLGARSEWDARMGVVFAGFMKILLPLLVVIPGIVAFKLFPGLSDKDQAFPTLVRELVPVGLSGIVMAGLASGMLSHISSVLNSCSTVFTMDLYKTLLGKNKTDQHLVRVGRFSAFGILTISTLLALWFTLPPSPTFSAGDFKDLPALATELNQQSDGVSQYLNGRFSETTRQTLSAQQGPGSDAGLLKEALVQEFNRVIRSQAIYEEQRFAGVKLAEETRRLLGQNPTGKDLVRLNRLLLEDAYPLAIVKKSNLGVFDLIQNVGAWVAAPIAAVFLLGVLWKRTTAAAATFVLLFAFPYTWLVEYVLFKQVSWLMPFDNWLNRTFLVWATSMVVLVAVSLLTPPPAPEKIKGIIWSWKVTVLPESERQRNRGLRNLLLWWCVFIGIMAVLYAYMMWFQFWGPGAGS